MSSEVFSVAFVEARTQAQIARDLQRDIQRTAQSIRRASESVAKSARLMQIKADATLKKTSETMKTIELERTRMEQHYRDITGYSAEMISSLAESIRKNAELLQVKATEACDETSETSAVSLAAERYTSGDKAEVSGFEKGEAQIVELEYTPEMRKIIQLGEVLSGAKSAKDTEYAELLIVSYAILGEPVMTQKDIELKMSIQRKIERIDSDANLTVFEKIDKVKLAIAEYSDGVSQIPEDVDAEEIASTYMALCERIGRPYGNLCVREMEALIPILTEQLIKIEEQEYITDSLIEAFEEEGILLDDVKSADNTRVFYMEDAENCELVINDVDGGFLMETVGLYASGTEKTDDDERDMKKSAKTACDKYKRVIKRLEEKGVIINIAHEDDPEKYLKICEEEAETFVRRRNSKGKKHERRARRREKKLKTFD